MTEPLRCVRCGAPLMKDDVAMTRKMINRGAETFYCLPCLADHFELTEDILREKIKEFKAMGCRLFD